jgi:hypothetical protein
MSFRIYQTFRLYKPTVKHECGFANAGPAIPDQFEPLVSAVDSFSERLIRKRHAKVERCSKEQGASPLNGEIT